MEGDFALIVVSVAGLDNNILRRQISFEKKYNN